MNISSEHCHALIVKDEAFSHKIDHFKNSEEILNPEGHLNHITGSKVNAIFLKLNLICGHVFVSSSFLNIYLFC